MAFPQPKILAATSLADVISPRDDCWLKGEFREGFHFQDWTLNLKLLKLIFCVVYTVFITFILSSYKKKKKSKNPGQHLGRLIIPVCSKLPMVRRKQVVIGCGMYSKCSSVCALPIPGLLLPAYTAAVLASAFVWLTANLFGKLSSHTGRELTGVSRSGFYKGLLNVRSSANLYFLGAKLESKCLIFPFPCSCGSFMRLFSYRVSLLLQLCYAITCSSKML